MERVVKAFDYYWVQITQRSWGQAIWRIRSGGFAHDDVRDLRGQLFGLGRLVFVWTAGKTQKAQTGTNLVQHFGARCSEEMIVIALGTKGWVQRSRSPLQTSPSEPGPMLSTGASVRTGYA
jgi:hypothetical protein